MMHCMDRPRQVLQGYSGGWLPIGLLQGKLLRVGMGVDRRQQRVWDPDLLLLQEDNARQPLRQG
jgi:hypothetical protein